VAAAYSVQGEKVLSLGIYYQQVRREVSVFRIIGSMRGSVGCLVQVAYQWPTRVQL